LKELAKGLREEKGEKEVKGVLSLMMLFKPSTNKYCGWRGIYNFMTGNRSSVFIQRLIIYSDVQKEFPPALARSR